MSIASSILEAIASLEENSATMNAIVNGPASGEGSTVETPGGELPTLARIAELLIGWQNAPFFTPGIREAVVDVEIVDGVLTLPCGTASNFILPLDADVEEIVITGATVERASSFFLVIHPDGTPRSFPAIADLPEGVIAVSGEYVPSSQVSREDCLSFITFDGGATWRMSIAWYGIEVA